MVPSADPRHLVGSQQDISSPTEGLDEGIVMYAHSNYREVLDLQA